LRSFENSGSAVVAAAPTIAIAFAHLPAAATLLLLLAVAAALLLLLAALAAGLALLLLATAATALVLAHWDSPLTAASSMTGK
jgi:hypothetical protein